MGQTPQSVLHLCLSCVADLLWGRMERTAIPYADLQLERPISRSPNRLPSKLTESIANQHQHQGFGMRSGHWMTESDCARERRNSFSMDSQSSTCVVLGDFWNVGSQPLEARSDYVSIFLLRLASVDQIHPQLFVRFIDSSCSGRIMAP